MTAKKSSTRPTVDYTRALVEDERRVLLYADAGPARVSWEFSKEILLARPDLLPEGVRFSIGTVLSVASWIGHSLFVRFARALLLTDMEATAIVAAHHGLRDHLIVKVQPQVLEMMHKHHASEEAASLWLRASTEARTARLLSGETCIDDEERLRRLAAARGSLARRRRQQAKAGGR